MDAPLTSGYLTTNAKKRRLDDADYVSVDWGPEGLYSGTAALAVGGGGGVTAICFAASLTIVLLAAGVLGLCALVLYGADILRLYRTRRRRVIELNSRMAAFAMAGLGASVVLIVVLASLGILAQHVSSRTFLVASGWLSELGLAKLYKIAAFLTCSNVTGHTR